MIFLDNATATKPSPTVISAMLPYFESQFFDPTSPYGPAQELLPEIEKAAEEIGSLIHAKDGDHFVFTASSEEAIAQVMHTVYREVAQRTGKIHFVTSEVEDASIVLSMSALEEESCLMSFAKVNKKGHVTKETLSEAITPRTALVSLSLASGLTGLIQPISEISALCKERGILLHLDVSHAIGKMNIDFEELGATFITFGGEEIHAGRGSGALFARGVKPVPLIQKAPLNTPFLIALRQAALEAKDLQMLYATEVARLRALFEETVRSICPQVSVLFQDAERLSHVTVMAFEGIRNEALLFQLSQKKLFATIGGGPFQPLDQVLVSSHIDPITSQTAISFALSKETTERDILQAATIVCEAVSRMSRLSKAML